MDPRLRRAGDDRVRERMKDERRGDHRRAVLVRAVVGVGAVLVIAVVRVRRRRDILVPVISTDVGSMARGGHAGLMVNFAVAQLADE
ncbi:hypothetical protein BH20GEM2_BH20GEM2_12720 [soil metagenome]